MGRTKVFVVEKKVIDNETGEEQWVQHHLLWLTVCVIHGVCRTTLISVVRTGEPHAMRRNIAHAALVDFAGGDDRFRTHRKKAEKSLADGEFIACALDNLGKAPCGDSAPA